MFQEQPVSPEAAGKGLTDFSVSVSIKVNHNDYIFDSFNLSIVAKGGK